MQISLSEEAFVELAGRHTVVPIALEVLADRLTPVSVFDNLVGGDEGFLFESVEGGERWGRWSFVGWNAAFTVKSYSGSTICNNPDVVIPEGDPLTVLEKIIEQHSAPPYKELNLSGPTPPLHSGAVGFLGYDMVRYIELLKDAPEDDRDLPEMLWQFVGGLAAFDRLRETVTLIVNVYVGDDPISDYRLGVKELNRAVERLGTGVGRLGTGVGRLGTGVGRLGTGVGRLGARDGSLDTGEGRGVIGRPSFGVPAEAEANMSRREFEDAVRRAKELIREGDVLQVVPSIRFEAEFSGDAFSVYRALRLINPSPYMFILRSDDLAIVGSSPELMSRVRGGRVYSRPIAGTRPRGANDEEDAALEGELLADSKEIAEHTMLIDLARNDLGRVCVFGSVVVDDLMVVERYSHVMHIVSGVSGELRQGVGPIDVLRATFPHGTVSGAPKVRAMEIIDELEPAARGPYAGAVGYIDFSGNIDTAIALRTCVSKGRRAWVQAGAGVVLDSDPASEYTECVNKAKAVLYAIEASGELD